MLIMGKEYATSIFLGLKASIYNTYVHIGKYVGNPPYNQKGVVHVHVGTCTLIAV
jgi:hypothetical protein